MKNFPDRILVFILVTVIAMTVSGKTITGIVSNEDYVPIKGVIVQLIEGEDPIDFMTTGGDGKFSFNTDTVSNGMILSFSLLDYESQEVVVSEDSVYNVVLMKKGTDLAEFVVRAPHTRVKGDTIVYDVASLTSKSDRNIGDIIRKLPGVTISGNVIYYDGEPINRFYIEDMNMLGGSYSVAANNINPEDIKSISVYERHQPKKVLKDVEFTDRAALNLTLKKKRMLRPIGFVKAGGGAGDRMLYDADVYGMLISPTNQSLLAAGGNNAGRVYGTMSETGGETRNYNLCSDIVNLYPLGSASLPVARYYNNNSAKVNASSLFKINRDYTMTSRVGYSFDKDNYSNATYTEYLGTGEDNVIYSDEGTSWFANHRVNACINLESNSESFYLLNELYFQGKFSDNDYRICNDRTVMQSLSNRDFLVEDRFNSIIRKGGNVFDVGARMTFSTSPHNRMTVVDNTSEVPYISQILKGNTFFSTFTAKYTSVWDTFSFGGDANADISLDSFKSDEGDSDMFVGTNEEHGYKIGVFLRPFFSFDIGRLKWRTEIPVSFHTIRYKDVVDNRIYSDSRPYIDFSSNLLWKMSVYISLQGGFSLRHDYGGLRDFIDNPLYTSYRTETVLGTGALSSSGSKRGNVMLRYSNPLNGLNTSLRLSCGRTDRNQLSSSVVSETEETVSSIERRNRINTFSWAIDAAKRMHNVVVKVSGNGMASQREAMRQNRDLTVDSRFRTVSATLLTYFLSDRLNMDVTAVYSGIEQRIKATGTKTDQSNVNCNFKISGFVIPYLELYSSVAFERSRLAEGGNRGYVFLDAGMRLKKRKFEIELKGANLTDERVYEYSITRSLDIGTYRYALRPLEVIATFKWMF
ncbi:MAG: Plug domain-containing protein [Muribaculaceae bacterium]|nr:Plug domain-containing protein [Muribaculaceae bacterium]